LPPLAGTPGRSPWARADRRAGGNRIEVTSGGYLSYDPDPEPFVWTEAERAKGQAWGVQTVESFHTYGTPDVTAARS
jgi:catechol 2,3-dioxygenase